MAKQKSGLRKGTGRSRGGPARRMGEMLPEIGGTAFKRFGFVQSSVVSRWNEIVGERYAKFSAPESIRFPFGKREGGTLNVLVAGAHAPMMQHVIPTILERVNLFFGYAAIAKVAIRQGEIARAEPLPPRLELVPLPVELGESLRTVADPELRAVLESLAQSVVATAKIETLGRVK
jgi:hypothetical protein